MYEDGLMLVCPMHAQEWSKNQVAVDSEAKSVTHDSNGNVLEDGDDVVIIKKCRYVVTRGTFSLTS